MGSQEVEMRWDMVFEVAGAFWAIVAVVGCSVVLPDMNHERGRDTVFSLLMVLFWPITLAVLAYQFGVDFCRDVLRHLLHNW